MKNPQGGSDFNPFYNTILNYLNKVVTNTGTGADANMMILLQQLVDIYDAMITVLGRQLYINKNGTVSPVVLDTTNPHANTPIPVTLTNIDGTTIVNVDVAGDLHVDIDAVADPVTGDYSSVRVSDGTHELAVNLDGSINVNYVADSAVLETPAKSTVVASGSVASGFRSVCMVTSDDFVGTILTDTAKAEYIYTITVSNPSNRLAAIAYTITSGSIEIITLL